MSKQCEEQYAQHSKKTQNDIERPRYLLADEFEIPPPIPKDEYQKLSTLYCDYQDHLDNTKEENELNKLLKLYETKQFDLIDPKRWNYFLQIYIWPKEPK